MEEMVKEMVMNEKEGEHHHRRDIVVPTLLPTKASLLTPLCKLSRSIFN